MTIDDRYARLLARRAPKEERTLRKSLEAYEEQAGTNTRYILGAITPVNETRTARLIEQGDRVENQLQTRLQPAYPGVVFRRQGSVSNGTHIRYYSDVDVLVIIDKFHDLEPPLTVTNLYKGDPNADLLALRASCVAALANAFPKTDIDDSGSTCVSISGGSLACPVDAVPASWYNTVAYSRGDGAHTRGVKVFNKKELKRKPNFPFLFNHRLHERDSARHGALRMLIRLLKTIKADYEADQSTSIDISSFDICSIVYRMPDEYLRANLRMPLDLVRNLLSWTYALATNEQIRTGLKAVDDSRLVFDGQRKLAALITLHNDLHALHVQAVKEQGGVEMISEVHLR